MSATHGQIIGLNCSSEKKNLRLKTNNKSTGEEFTSEKKNLRLKLTNNKSTGEAHRQLSTQL
jgi:hypothetical protein